jgi:hypothetical protein
MVYKSWMVFKSWEGFKTDFFSSCKSDDHNSCGGKLDVFLASTTWYVLSGANGGRLGQTLYFDKNNQSIYYKIIEL